MLTPWVDAAASLLLGSACPGCGTPTAQLCTSCAPVVGDPTPFAVVGTGVPVVAAGAYADVWQRCIVAYKERGGWWLGAPLGRALALAVGGLLAGGIGLPGELVLVPMPSQPRSVRERGLDTTLLLARVAARSLAASGLPTRVDPVLRHVRRVSDQSALGEHERRRNLVGALSARVGLPGVRVVVDDLTTTGASLVEACRALDGAGTPASGCAVVAATPLRRANGERTATIA